MQFSHVSIGGGITGVETIISIIREIEQKIKKNKNKDKKFKSRKFNFAIIDKNPENIPGGVGYGFKTSQYGYFNNPCRLSPNKFVDWVIKKKNIIKIFDYLETEGGISGRQWIKKNFFLKKKIKKKNLSEIYLPRAALGFWMKEKYIETLKLLKKLKDEKKINIQLFFAENKAVKIKKNNEKFVICLAKNSNINRINFALFILKGEL